jgi:uncharacterized spore protein YtfJ
MDVGNLLEKTSESLSVRRAFGAAYEKDGMLIIPVAMVAGGGGAGTARLRPGNPPGAASPGAASPGAAASDAPSPDAPSSDTGGGFGGLVLPIGAYVVKGDRVRWVPAVDATIVVLASLGLVRLLTRTWALRRSRHGQRVSGR